MIKRAFDFVVALISIVLLGPVFIAVAVAIKLDSRGPVFYRAVRIGRDGLPFLMFKFRTMVDGPAGEGPRVTAQDDPRITRLGRFLRNAKINELPQLVNVLRGEMSLVGPRPEDPRFAAHYTAEQRRVFSVRPGITSPASILYRHEEAMLTYQDAAQSYLRDILPSKLRLDLLYVQSHSFLLDLDVLVQTVLVLMPVLRQEAIEAASIFSGPIQRLAREQLPWFLLDWLTALVAIGMAGLVWRAQGPLDLGWARAPRVALGLALAFSLTNWLLGLQRTAWRYAGVQEIPTVTVSAGLATTVLVSVNHVLRPRLPVGLLLLGGGIAFVGFVTMRYRSRLLSALWDGCRQVLGIRREFRERVLVVGGGEAGRMMIWMLQNGLGPHAFQVVGIIDDDLWKLGVSIRHVRVLGDRTRIPEVVDKQRIDLIAFAIHNISPATQDEILSICRTTPARIVVMPNIAALLAPETDAGGLEPELSPSEAAPASHKRWPSRIRLPGVAARMEH